MQTYVANRVTKDLNETYGTNINIHRLGLNWKGEVDIREVYIADHHDDTLIYSKELQTNILSFQNLIKGDLGFGNIALSNAKLYVKTYKDEEDDNLYIFSEKFNTGKQSSTPFTLFSNDVILRESHVKITDENLDTPVIFDLTNVNAIADNFKITGPDVFANIKELSLNADRGFSIKNLKSDFSYTTEAISLKELTLESEDSEINGEVIMTYGDGGLGDFENTVVIKADLNNTKISTNDLNAFYNEFGTDQLIFLNGSLDGTLNDFTFENARLESGDMRVVGNFAFKDLLKGSDLYSITALNHSIRTNYYELRRFMPRVLGDVLPEQLKVIGTFTFQGNTSISATKLDTKSTIRTSIGSAETNLSMGNINDFDNAYYKGNIRLDNFNLGKIANSISFGTMTANLNVDGRGFTQNTVSTAITGKISSFTFEGYTYKNINVSGNLKNPLFNGELTINDPNLKLDFKGLVDVSKDFNQYDFEADVTYAELNKLNLFKRDSVSVFAGKVIMDMDGTTINDAKGTISFMETFYQTADDDFYFDDFKIISTFEGPVRTITIDSPDIINGSITGEFLVEDIPNLFVNGIGSIYTNYIPSEVTTNQYIDYNFTVYNKIVEVFVPQLQLGENTRIRGSVSSDQSKFKLDFRSPEIVLFDNYMNTVNLQVDNDNPLYNTFIAVDSVDAGFYDVIDVNVINKTIKDTLFVRAEFKGGSKKEDLFNLSLYHTINPSGKSVVGVKKSDITYKENVWYLNENEDRLNKVVFDDNFQTVRIDSLVLSHNNEIIQMSGQLRDSTYKDLKLQFNDVNIGNLTPHIDSLRLAGNLNGKLNFLQKNGAYYPDSKMRIDNVIINDIGFGDLLLSVTGNENLTEYSINTSLTNNQVKSINAVGKIDVSPNNPRIEMKIDLNEFNMQAFSPFGGDVITDIRGLISGSARVSGDYKSPDILGRFNLENSGLKVPYLNTDFDLDENTTVLVTKNKLEINNSIITDTKYGTTGLFTGNATHENFSKWALDLSIQADERLLVLDTPAEEDALYYGTAFISGEATIAGPIDELVIDVLASTEEGTTFKIPLSDTESIGDDSFIRFLSPKEKEARISGEQLDLDDPKGLSLNFDLDINDNAEVEVVVDQVNNSRLIGRGAGTLLIRINTLGKFQMWGEFTVIEGLFDFRYGGLIQRNIAVVPGGNINWDGVPERARLDISAKYSTEANPSVLLDNPTVNRRIPVDVLVDLTGEIIQPDLNFRIEFPRTSSVVRSELEYKLQNQEQRQKQALFLVATNTFISDTYDNAGIAPTALVAERVSGIVNELFADQDGKFKVGLDYSQGSRLPNQESADRFGITLSTQINERILINGKVGIPVGGVNETAIAGDIEVQWLVNEDGSLRMKFFNRQADIQFIGEDQIFEQGGGISYSVDFDTFRELVDKLFNKKLTLESEEPLPVTPDDNSLPVNFNTEARQENE
ncbi:translocation/assembly module TamB domain-containing protein [Cochleicola gelatinilyticus]|uniref:translocation/assembly module TamB domain-containing protein n=1 Tax=Cochleicola gelatinilyticus TaxID=1763537 RepID=UPI001F527050|nr:translocation/assembly module TamB domain-containing protein [Cochleicola gelatinilyticus]